MKKLILFVIVNCSLHIGHCYSQWIQQNSGTTGDLNSVYFVNSQTGWVCGVTGSQNIDRIAKTTDGGITWIRQNAGTFYVLNSIQFINDQTGWAAGIHGTVVKTTNGGTNWFQVLGTNLDLNDIQFIDAQTGWAAGSQVNGIYKTTDGGLNWSNYFFQNYFVDIHFVNNFTGWGVKLGFNSEIDKTINGGLNWTGYLVPNIVLGSCYFINESIGWIGGINDSVPEKGKILITTNSGSNWVINDLDTNTYPGSIQFINQNHGWFCGNSGKIFITTNSGYNWFRQNTSVTAALRDIFFVDSLNGWSVGEGGVILKTTNGGGPLGVSTISTEIPLTFRLYQNYPNPFNPNTKIRFDIEKSDIVELNIFDGQGKHIETLMNQQLKPGEYEVVWDASLFASGIYFYKLETANFIQTKKMLLIK